MLIGHISYQVFTVSKTVLTINNCLMRASLACSVILPTNTVTVGLSLLEGL